MLAVPSQGVPWVPFSATVQIIIYADDCLQAGRTRRMRQKLMWWAIAVLAVVLLGAALWGPIVSNVEQPKYKVVESSDNIEIRDYAPMIVAEAEVSGDRREAIGKGFRLIADYIFAKDKIFAHLNLERRDLILYEKVATLMERELPKPDLVIYLQSSTERLIEHIRRRNRKFERNVSSDYIRQLNEAYNSFFFHYKETPLLVVNTSEIDFVHKEEDLNDLIRQIENPPVGVKYYVPLKT